MRKGLIIGLCCVLGNFCLSSNAQEALPNDSTILKNARREAKENAIKSDTVSPLIKRKTCSGISRFYNYDWQT
jgi:hypothetical protein